ncbi:MAG: CDP-alcohol phosphatidyltransferase family protein [Solirubrobacteraceae bacterium]
MGADPLIPPAGDPGDRPDPPERPDDDGRPADEASGSVRERAEQVRDRTRERAEHVRERTRERTEQVRERTRERTEHVRERTREKAEQVLERTEQVRERTRMTVYRMFGLDRSGPPPPQTLPGAPLNPWTIPNAVGALRLVLIPVFLVLALSSDEGTDLLPALIFAFVAGSDYLDGFLARLTGQYSRLGTLLDPLTDRSLVLSGGVVCWHFDLLPRWVLAILVVRELYVLLEGRRGVRNNLTLQVNWWGRLAVWPTMGALFLGLLGVGWPAHAMLYVGVGMGLVAAYRYTVDGRRELRERRAAATTHD